jgi:hypothetical protein
MSSSSGLQSKMRSKNLRKGWLGSSSFLRDQFFLDGELDVMFASEVTYTRWSLDTTGDAKNMIELIGSRDELTTIRRRCVLCELYYYVETAY